MGDIWFSRSVTLVSPAKTAEPIEVPLGLRTWVGPGHHVLDGVQIPHGNGQFWGGKQRTIVKYKDTPVVYAKTAEPIEMRFGTFCRELWKNSWTSRFAIWTVDSGGPKEAQVQSYSPMPLNRPCATAMRPAVKLLWPLVISTIVITITIISTYLSVHWALSETLA